MLSLELDGTLAKESYIALKVDLHGIHDFYLLLNM